MVDGNGSPKANLESEGGTPTKDYVSRVMSALALCVSILAGSAQAWDVFVQAPRERERALALRLDGLFSDYADCFTQQGAATMSGDPLQQAEAYSRCMLVRTNLISELSEAGDEVIDLLDTSDLVHAAWALTEVEQFNLSNLYSSRALERASDTFASRGARTARARNNFYASAGQDHEVFREFLADLERSDTAYNYYAFANAATIYVGAMSELAQCDELSTTTQELQERFDALRQNPRDRMQFSQMLAQSISGGECS